MRCDALLVEGAGRFRWWFGPCPARLARGVLAVEPVGGPCPQRPDRILAPAALAPLGPGSILPCSFFQPPTMLCRPMPIPPSAFRPFSPSFRSSRPSNVTLSILHSPFSTTTTRPPHTDTTLCKFLHPCHYQLCTYATQTAIRSTINLIFGCAPIAPSLTTRSSTLSAAWTRPGPNS